MIHEIKVDYVKKKILDKKRSQLDYVISYLRVAKPKARIEVKKLRDVNDVNEVEEIAFDKRNCT